MQTDTSVSFETKPMEGLNTQHLSESKTFKVSSSSRRLHSPFCCSKLTKMPRKLKNFIAVWNLVLLFPWKDSEHVYSGSWAFKNSVLRTYFIITKRAYEWSTTQELAVVVTSHHCVLPCFLPPALCIGREGIDTTKHRKSFPHIPFPCWVLHCSVNTWHMYYLYKRVNKL